MADIKSVMVTDVPAGSQAVLNCQSNDVDHNFMFWLYNGTDVIGPGNPYDATKYKYEVLSGKLLIHNVSPKEAGYYHCVSKKLSGSGYSVGQVDMVVSGTAIDPMEVIKFVAIVLSILVIVGCAVLYFRIKREWRNYEGRTVVPVEDVEDDDNDGDEVYNQTTTAINHPEPGPSHTPTSDHLLYGIDNQGLDTDFNSVFENIQIKSPHPSLI